MQIVHIESKEDRNKWIIDNKNMIVECANEMQGMRREDIEDLEQQSFLIAIETLNEIMRHDLKVDMKGYVKNMIQNRLKVNLAK